MQVFNRKLIKYYKSNIIVYNIHITCN